MSRRKKINTLQSEKKEVAMTEEIKPEVKLDNMETEIDLKRKELEQVKVEIEEKKKALKRLDNREYSKQEREISERQVATQSKGAALKEKIEKQKAYDSEMVTGRFINRRHPGKASEKLTYMKYETDAVKWWDFCDGKVYTIPRGFVEQIKEHYNVPKFTQSQEFMDPDRPQSAISNIDTSNKKYDFVPLNF